jgi:hypothetical protein
MGKKNEERAMDDGSLTWIMNQQDKTSGDIDSMSVD